MNFVWMGGPPPPACKHGQLARSCNICELEAERDRLAAENKRLREALERCREMVGRPDNIAFIDAALKEKP